MENETNVAPLKVTPRDYKLGIIAGILIGILLLPILRAAKPDLYSKVALFVIPLFLAATPIGILIASAIAKKIAIVWQLAKFVLIGGLNTVVDLGVLAFVTFLFRSYLGISSKDLFFGSIAAITFYSLFKATSFIVANINSYYWNKYWTFEHGAVKKTATEFTQFFVVSVIGFVINVTIASYVFKAVNPLAGLNSDQWGLMGAAAGSIAGLAWNFIGYKFIVFKKKPDAENAATDTQL